MLLIVSIIALMTSTAFSQNWNYNNQLGWSTVSASCASNRQSPINIKLNDVKIRRLKLKFNNYNQRFSRSIAENTGYTVEVLLNARKDKIPHLTGSAVRNQKFILDTFHFHWGQNNTVGSEHTIDGIQYAGELHFVHYNEIHGNVSVARDMVDGLTVLTVFLKLSPFENYALNPILNAIPNIITSRTNTVIRDAIYLKDLLPLDGNVFFRYNGSLTTPPCRETATFIILANGIYINASQVSKFRNVFDDANGRLTNNYREIQAINNRIIEANGYPVIG